MSHSRFMSSPIIYLISATLLLQSVFAVHPLYHSCLSSKKFTANGPYEHNSKKLITTIQSPLSGYANGSWGHNTRNEVFGLSLCRGDVTFDDGKSCLAKASTVLLQRCLRIKGAIIWGFFGGVDFTNMFSAANTEKVSDTVTFNNKATGLLNRLALEASGNSKLYAAGEMDIGKSEKLYSMAQCTRDLIGFDCYRYLDYVITDVPRYCDGKRGCRIVNGSCSIGYELYPFVNA